MFLKGMATHNLSKLKNSRRDVPIWSQWCLVQGAACRMAALSTSCGGHSGYTCLSGFFPRFAKKQLLFCSLQTLSFSCWKSFNLEPYTKTESEFPSRGKPHIPGKTSQQWRLKTYRDHTRTESFMKTSTEDFDNFLMTSTGHSDASVSCEHLYSCAPGATATLDLGRPMHVLLSKRPKKSRNKNRMQ